MDGYLKEKALINARKVIHLFFEEKNINKIFLFLHPSTFTWIGPGSINVINNHESLAERFKKFWRENSVFKMSSEVYRMSSVSTDSCLVTSKIKFYKQGDSGDNVFLASFYFQQIDNDIYIMGCHIHSPKKISYTHEVSKAELNNSMSNSNFLWMNYNDAGFYISDNLMVKPRYRRLIKGENAVDFTPLEFTIFMVLSQHKNETVAQETLCEAVWGDNNISDSSSTLKMHISNLRRKLKNLLCDKFNLCFVPQKGYCLSFK